MRLPDHRASSPEQYGSRIPELASDQPLIWSRVGLGVREFELRRGPEVVGGMEGSTRFGFSATGYCLEEEWEIRLRSKFFGKVEVTLEDPDRGQPGCRFEGLFFGTGKVFLPSGSELRWRHPFLRIYNHILEVKGGSRILQIRPAFLRFLRTETRVNVFPAAAEMPDLPGLLLLSWFLKIHTERRGRRVF